MALDLPISLLVEVTSRCNLTCRMCPRTAPGTPSSHIPGDASARVLSTILETAAEVGHVGVAGYGEPLLSRECLPFLRALDGRGVDILLSTNGTTITTAVARELAGIRRLTGVNVSLDAADEDTYRSVRGGELSAALRGLRILAEERRSHQEVQVSAVVLRQIVESLEGFPHLLADLGLRVLVLQVRADYAPLGNGDALLDSELREAIGRCREAGRVAGVDVLVAESGGSACTLPWDVPVIDKDGRVFPCCRAVSRGSASLGDLTRSSLREVWFGKDYEDFRGGLLGTVQVPGICRDCRLRPEAHPLRNLASSPVSLLPSGSGRRRAMVRNLGERGWTARSVLIGTCAPRDRPSRLYVPTWVSGNRVATFTEQFVAPGETATFDFEVAWAEPTVAETFQLVAEGLAWLPGTRFVVRSG